MSCWQKVELAVILAGGLGKRLRSMVADVPKPMAPINGRPFLEYQLDYWISQGIREFILSVGYLKNIIIDHFGKEYCGAKMNYINEEMPLGTGGGLLTAINNISSDQPFLVLNGDTFFKVPLRALMDFHKKNSSSLTFSLFRTNEFQRYLGIIISPEGEIISFRDKTNTQNNFLANGGVYLVESTKIILPYGNTNITSPISFEQDILPIMRNNNEKLFGYECLENFIDIGIPIDYIRAHDTLL
jgi:D-glycero-alpha-D-manno-heptose 1-phosphate guanylyltransferase